MATLNYEKDEDFESKGLMKIKVKVCHIDRNRNGSNITKENMKKAMPSLKYRPLLAYIHQLDDGTYNFHAHDYVVKNDDEGNEYEVFLEQQIGTFICEEPFFEKDKKNGKTYVCSYALIPETYTKACDIIRYNDEHNNGTKVSCELVIQSMSYNAKEKYLDLEDFYFDGVTCLGYEKNGKAIGEGMVGSRLDIADFNENNDDIVNFSNENLTEAIKEVVESTVSKSINEIFENFKIKEEGESLKYFEQLLKKYNKELKDITFEYEGLTDEELEAKFEEAFGVKKEPIKNKENDFYTINDDKSVTVSFNISHEDIRSGLYALLSNYSEEDGVWYYITEVYDDYFIYEDGWGKTIYGQKYIKIGDNVQFKDERYKLRKEYLTEDEYTELKEMRNNYNSYKEKYEELSKKEDNQKKKDLIKSESYQLISETEEMKKYIEDVENDKCEFTSKELEEKLDLLLLNAVKNNSLNLVNNPDDKEKKEKHFSNSKLANGKKQPEKEDKKLYGKYSVK